MINKLDNNKITVVVNGKEIECDILFSYDSFDTDKSYIGYTDNSYGENARKNIYLSSYNPETNELEDVVDIKELKLAQEVLKCLDEDANKKL